METQSSFEWYDFSRIVVDFVIGDRNTSEYRRYFNINK
jgi:hypothetical protein